MKWFALALGLCVAFTAEAKVIEQYVAPQGDDSGDGSKRHPVRSIERARDNLRNSGHPGGGRIVLQSGDYWLKQPLGFTHLDNGVEVVSEKHASPRILGGIKVEPKSFQPVEDKPTMDWLAPEARGKLVWADLKALGIVESKAFPDISESPPVCPELFFDGKRQTLSRWPNDGWAEIAEVVESGPAPWRNYASDKKAVFKYDGDRPAHWNLDNGVWLQGYWCFDWAIATVKVDAIDSAAHAITLAAQPYYGVGSGNSAKRRYAALNLLEELDTPGEYCFDWKLGRLYFWPPADLQQKETMLSRLEDALLTLQDCKNMTLRGLTVEMGQDTGIAVNGGESNTIDQCTVRNMGLQGMSVEGGTRHTVTRCKIYEVGTGGLRLSGGDRKTLTPCGHVAENNEIYNVGRRQRTHADHVDIAGVGVRIAHNLLHDGPHQAIGVAGNDHIIEYNEVHHIGLESDDCGALYMGRNPSERGNQIRYNYFHHTGGPFAHGSCAVYLDDGQGGQKIYGNVFYKAAGGSFGAIFNHGGHDNVAENNVFIECKRPIGASPWGDKAWDQWVTGDLWKKSLREEVDITSAVYLKKYPELEHFYKWEGTPRKNRAVHNVFYKCAEPMNGNWEDVDNLSTAEDPGFRKVSSENFELKRRAGVFNSLKGFERVPFSQMGLQR